MTTFSRKLIDAKQKAKGREPMRFLFKVKPLSITDIARDVESIVFVWQRAAKIQETKVQPVNASTGSVMFDTDTELSQSTTCYKSGDQWQSKEYKFKLQSVTNHKGIDKTKTIAKYDIDFSVFCPMGVMGGSEDIQVNMKPRGVFNATVTAQWLKDFDHNLADDVVSDMFNSVTHSNRSWDGDMDDHDLDDLHPPLEDVPPPRPPANGGSRRAMTAQARLPSTIKEGEEGEELDFEKEPVAPPPPPMPKQQVSLTKPEQQQQSSSWFGVFKKSKSTKLTDSDLEFIGKQVNVELLRKKAKELVSQRDMETTKALQLQNELKILEQTLEKLSPNERQMVNKIRTLEQQLAESQETDTMQLLVDAKTQLADAHFQILELKGELYQEQRRNRQILGKFTSVQTQRDILLSRK
eukprot:TRINITY_DN10083_c0_g1_i4.p1 TRINITY_DN10083_c0_g1~~TRINITY_DN10083_c0_g1_i4.p1  ORF type:complete len:409 (-),score=56.35 TRINITY_DN10083_c0_g1_i4:439-1665(-)